MNGAADNQFRVRTKRKDVCNVREDPTTKRPGTAHGSKAMPHFVLAVVAGDFIMTAHEVQPTLRALRKGNIHIVALHNHMIGEEPAYYFTHFWGKGHPGELATSIKTALDVQKSVNNKAH